MSIFIGKEKTGKCTLLAGILIIKTSYFYINDRLYLQIKAFLCTYEYSHDRYI